MSSHERGHEKRSSTPELLLLVAAGIIGRTPVLGLCIVRPEASGRRGALCLDGGATLCFTSVDWEEIHSTDLPNGDAWRF